MLSGGASQGLLEAPSEHAPQPTIITSHGRTGLSRMFWGCVNEDIL